MLASLTYDQLVRVQTRLSCPDETYGEIYQQLPDELQLEAGQRVYAELFAVSLGSLDLQDLLNYPELAAAQRYSGPPERLLESMRWLEDQVAIAWGAAPRDMLQWVDPDQVLTRRLWPAVAICCMNLPLPDDGRVAEFLEDFQRQRGTAWPYRPTQCRPRVLTRLVEQGVADLLELFGCCPGCVQSRLGRRDIPNGVILRRPYACPTVIPRFSLWARACECCCRFSTDQEAAEACLEDVEVRLAGCEYVFGFLPGTGRDIDPEETTGD